MKPILLSALVLALAIGAKAGWDDLPATGNVIDRRGEPRPPKPVRVIASLAGHPGEEPTPLPQYTVPQQEPPKPWAPSGTVWGWTHGK
jgi:hypothetical protein